MAPHKVGGHFHLVLLTLSSYALSLSTIGLISCSHSAPNPFVQASGVAKALAIAQTKGGTVWQDLSFCYINIVAPPVRLVAHKFL